MPTKKRTLFDKKSAIGVVQVPVEVYEALTKAYNDKEGTTKFGSLF